MGKHRLWEALEISFGGHESLSAHQNWAWEPKTGSKTALKPPPYLITDNSVMGMDSGTNGHV